MRIQRHYEPDVQKAVEGLRRLLSLPDKHDDHPVVEQVAIEENRTSPAREERGHV